MTQTSRYHLVEILLLNKSTCNIYLFVYHLIVEINDIYKSILSFSDVCLIISCGILLFLFSSLTELFSNHHNKNTNEFMFISSKSHKQLYRISE